MPNPTLRERPEPAGAADRAEVRRLAELGTYRILDTDPEPAYDALVRVAASIARTPASTISLIDAHRQWFKAAIGMTDRETTRELAFCDHVVRGRQAIVMDDASVDRRFADHPLVVAEPRIRFYAGFPLTAPSGDVLGTLCVFDYRPRHLDEQQVNLLRVLSEQVMAQLTLRRALYERDRELAERHQLVAQVAESERRFRTLVETSPDVIARLDPDGRATYISPALKTVYGLSPEAVVAAQDALGMMVHPGDENAAHRALTDADAGRRREFTTRFPHPDGHCREVDVVLLPVHDDEGTVTETMLVARDVTEAARARSALASATQEAVHRSDQCAEVERIAGLSSWSIDLDTQECWWSPQLYRLLGVSPEDNGPTAALFHSFVHPDDRARVLAAGEQARREGADVKLEYRIVRGTGDIRTVQAHSRHEPGPGERGRLVGTLLDVTDLRRTERELMRSRNLLAQVLDGTDHAFIATDPEGRITMWNRGAERMLGYPAASVLGTTRGPTWYDPQELDPPAADRPARSRSRTYVAKDGTRRTASVTTTAMRDEKGTVTGSIDVLTDITAQVRAERERDAQSHMLRAVIQNDQSIITVKDLEGRYLMVNRAFEEAFGISGPSILGLTDQALSPEHAADWRAGDLQARHGPVRLDDIADLPDGRRYYETVKVPLFDASGEITAVCTVALDVTERRRAEIEKAGAMEAMAEARDVAVAATKAKSAFLATMSHEIRTPMNAVIGMTGLLLETPLNDEQRELLHTVRSSGDQLLAIINDILDFSKIEAGDLELEEHPFELRDCVEGALAQFAGSGHDIDLVTHVDDDCPAVVVGDATRLRQVLTNLVGNALKFTRRGDVLLQVETAEAGPGDTARAGLRFTVADTGIGIAEEDMGRLFKSFSQVDASTTRLYGGTGLGLAISKAIVEAMGGRITVTSEVGVGSRFTFVATFRVPGDRPARPAPDRNVLAGRRVLVIDDNDTSRRVLRIRLEGYGMVCEDEASPLAALARIGGGARFDLAILDHTMPVMDGVQAALALRHLPAAQHLPLILLSGAGRRDRGLKKLFSTILTKPVRGGALVEALEQVLGAPAAGPEPRAPRTGPGPGRRRTGLRVLLVEDNEINQKVGRLMLARLGHTVDLAVNGTEAVEAVGRADYDVVLMDMHMPVMDGLEATRTIRARIPQDRQPHIIAMTASVTKEDRDACADAGMDGYLAKPVRAEDLTEALEGVPVRR